jgi:peptide/nickel transport system permease protein
VSVPAVTPAEAAVARGRWRAPSLGLLRHALHFRRTQVGLVFFSVSGFVAIFGPFLAPESPTAFVDAPFSDGSSLARLGTDYLGRDTLSRFLYGGRSVLGMALAATAIGVAAGVAVGLVAARARRWSDEALMRGGDIILAFPPIILALILVSTIGPKVWLLILAVAVTHAPRVARLARGAALEVLERDFVSAADALGERRWRMMFQEVLPNIASPLLVEASMRLTFSITILVGLSFLGFGLQPPAADWGLMVNENRTGLIVQPMPVILPLAAIALLTIGVNLIADGVGRALIGIDRRVGDA